MLLYLVICEYNLSMFFVFANHEQYDGHSLYQIKVSNTEEMEIINNVVNQLYLDVWSRSVPNRPGYILVPKDGKEVFEISLNAGGINYEIVVKNIRDLLKLEEQQLKYAATRNQNKGFNISFDMVYNYDEINNYLQYLAKTYSYVEIVNGGLSFENRPIYYLKISTTNFKENKKPIVMLQSLIHSRDWATSSVTLYAINKLVVDKTEPDLLNNIDWIIVPVLNPDGYIYTHTTDRFWRKNRRSELTASNVCAGVDLNRNFDVNWGIASSNDSCDGDFHGTGPSSEPETQAIANIIMAYKSRILLFFDIHSFGSLILYAYGNYSEPKNEFDLYRLADRMAQAIDKVKAPEKPNYYVDNIAQVIDEVSGCASDFVQAAGVPLSFSFELPAYNKHYNDVKGFLVDSQHISQTSFETWEGITVGARYVSKLKPTDIKFTNTDLFTEYI